VPSLPKRQIGIDLLGHARFNPFLKAVKFAGTFSEINQINAGLPFDLKLLRQGHVNETTGRIVKKVGIVLDRGCVRRILTEDVVAAKCDADVI